MGLLNVADLAKNLQVLHEYAGSPKSGTAGTFAGFIEAGAPLVDTNSGVIYINEGTKASPYYTPLGLEKNNALFGVSDDFSGLGAGKAIADTAAELVLPTGLRVFGQGVEVNGDAGFITGAGVEGALKVGTLHVTNEASHLTALGTDAGVYQPDQHGTLVVEVTFTDDADILTSSVFLGFVGTAADALDPAVTGATTTATFQQDDLAGMYSDSSMTDVNGTFLVSEKSNTGGTQTSLTSVVDRQAAATYQTWRVEIDKNGVGHAFADKVDLGVIPGTTAANTHADTEPALDVDEEVSPVFYVENSTTTTRTATIQRFSTWATRA